MFLFIFNPRKSITYSIITFNDNNNVIYNVICLYVYVHIYIILIHKLKFSPSAEWNFCFLSFFTHKIKISKKRIEQKKNYMFNFNVYTLVYMNKNITTKYSKKKKYISFERVYWMSYYYYYYEYSITDHQWALCVLRLLCMFAGRQAMMTIDNIFLQFNSIIHFVSYIS